MIEQRQDIANIVMRAFGSMPEPATWRDREETSYALADAILALIQKEQGWRDIESAPRDGTLMLLELDDGSIKLGRYHISPTYSFLWWSEDAAPLSEPRRWLPTPPQGEDET